VTKEKRAKSCKRGEDKKEPLLPPPIEKVSMGHPREEVGRHCFTRTLADKTKGCGVERVKEGGGGTYRSTPKINPAIPKPGVTSQILRYLAGKCPKTETGLTNAEGW